MGADDSPAALELSSTAELDNPEFTTVLPEAGDSISALELGSTAELDKPESTPVLREVGGSPAALELCFTAGLAEPEVTLVLHLGHRILKGRDGVLVSSTCSREAHFGQIIVMAGLKECT